MIKKSANPSCIAIVGLGLMGASLAAACRKKFPKAKIIGISRNQKALRFAFKKKWVHEATSDLARGVSAADIVVLCTPLDTFQSLLKEIEKNARPGTLVTDVGSVKGQIVSWTDRCGFKKIRFVGAHPMVGSHERGVSAARPDLYDKGFTIIVRSSKTSPIAYSQARDFWRRVSPKIFELSPAAHDRITGEISHLPHVVAVCLMLSATRDSLGFAASGFLDTTRIAQGHPSIWTPIFKTNQKAVLSALAVFESRLKSFKKALRGKGTALASILGEASQKRGQISL